MYQSCNDALHTVRRECPPAGSPDYDQCMRGKNVHALAQGVRECPAGAVRCELAGTTAPRFACVLDATAPQTVYGLPLHGNPSRVLAPQDHDATASSTR